MVDEKFELAAVIFRLAGYQEYNYLESGYQKEVAETFSTFKNHEAAEYAKSLGFSYDKVLKFAVHIEKRGNKFVFINDTNSLYGKWHWNKENAAKFLKLFNKFYIDAGYSDFFGSHIELFEERMKKFIDAIYGKIDFDWFGKYIDKSNLRCIYSLSSGNYAATVNQKIIYSLVYSDGGAVFHEFCHGIANPLAEKWLDDNPDFKKWCDESINIEKMPFYNNSWAMACEYVTRAYNVLYHVQHGANLEDLLENERNHIFEGSFKYINEVYNMILRLENKSYAHSYRERD